ncbi:MAG: hypothetical protein GY851_08850 [bacterium]|nr:hypothetical protein [bacterium]
MGSLTRHVKSRAVRYLCLVLAACLAYMYCYSFSPHLIPVHVSILDRETGQRYEVSEGHGIEAVLSHFPNYKRRGPLFGSLIGTGSRPRFDLNVEFLLFGPMTFYADGKGSYSLTDELFPKFAVSGFPEDFLGEIVPYRVVGE